MHEIDRLVITFYYTERVVDLNYVIVAPDDTVYSENQTWGKLTSFGESVKVSTGKANGSTASVESNVYKFVGWYSDEACTNQLSTDATYVPAKGDGELWIDGTTYYAKFDYNLTSLTIKKEGWESIDPNQTFIFTVTGADPSGKETTLEVTVHGNGSVTVDGLTVGQTYTVTEKTGWSWRYSYSSVSVTNAEIVVQVSAGAKITISLDGTITFTNSRTKEQWLDGDSWCNNIFNK